MLSGPFHYEEPAGNPLQGESSPVHVQQHGDGSGEEASEQVETFSVVVQRLPEAEKFIQEQNQHSG